MRNTRNYHCSVNVPRACSYLLCQVLIIYIFLKYLFYFHVFKYIFCLLISATIFFRPNLFVHDLKDIIHNVFLTSKSRLIHLFFFYLKQNVHEITKCSLFPPTCIVTSLRKKVGIKLTKLLKKFRASTGQSMPQ